MTAVVTCLADLRLWAEQRARFAHVAVLLAKMNAIRAQSPRKSHAVVDDEGDIRVGADALERLGEPSERVLLHLLHPKLECRSDTRLQGRS
jgi:hypothetical protein